MPSDKHKHATLIINRNDSSCLNCGENAWPDEKQHITVPGLNKVGVTGCKITWENVTTEYVGELMECTAKKYRPDLKFIPFREVYDLYVERLYGESNLERSPG